MLVFQRLNDHEIITRFYFESGTSLRPLVMYGRNSSCSPPEFNRNKPTACDISSDSTKQFSRIRTDLKNSSTLRRTDESAEVFSRGYVFRLEDVRNYPFGAQIVDHRYGICTGQTFFERNQLLEEGIVRSDALAS